MRKKIMVLVTGCPGCGKTTFTSKIMDRFPFFTLSSYDKVKEEFFDRYGFDSLEERAALNAKSLARYYEDLNALMKQEIPIITDYPFSRLAHEKDLNRLVSENGYQALSITLYGDLKVLLERGSSRDLADKTRNFGHMLTRYHKDHYSESDRIPVMDLKAFNEMVEKKDYFIQVGDSIRIDVTDYTTIDYETVFSTIENMSC